MTKLELLGLKSIERKAAAALEAIDFVQKNSIDSAINQGKLVVAWNKLTDVIIDLRAATDE
jgi:hypothetical protein